MYLRKRKIESRPNYEQGVAKLALHPISFNNQTELRLKIKISLSSFSPRGQKYHIMDLSHEIIPTLACGTFYRGDFAAKFLETNKSKILF